MKIFLLVLILAQSPALGRADSNSELQSILKPDDQGGNGALEIGYVRALQNQGKFKCTNTKNGDGAFCIDPSTNYVLVPRDLKQLKKLVFYAHGLTSVCGPGVSGENYLKDQMGKLKSIGAIAVMPYRKNALDLSYQIDPLIKKIEKMLGATNIPWTMAGHSAGGEFIASMLAKNSSVLNKVDKVLMLDAAFCIDHSKKPCSYRKEAVVDNWKKVLRAKPLLKIVSISGVSHARAESLKKILSKEFPGVMTNRKESGSHCEMTKYFGEL